MQTLKTAQSYSNECILAAAWIYGELRIIKQIYVYNQLTMSNMSRPRSREMFISSAKDAGNYGQPCFKTMRHLGMEMHALNPRPRESEAGASLI